MDSRTAGSGAPVEGDDRPRAHAAGQLARGARLGGEIGVPRTLSGKDFLKIFYAIETRMPGTLSAEVSELDYAWYLRADPVHLRDAASQIRRERLTCPHETQTAMAAATGR